jgi:hypothetical protein
MAHGFLGGAVTDVMVGLVCPGVAIIGADLSRIGKKEEKKTNIARM